MLHCQELPCIGRLAPCSVLIALCAPVRSAIKVLSPDILDSEDVKGGCAGEGEKKRVREGRDGKGWKRRTVRKGSNGCSVCGAGKRERTGAREGTKGKGDKR